MPAPEVVFVGDVGGSQMRLGVAAGGNLLHHEILKTPDDPDEFFATIGTTALRFIEDYSVEVGSIGFPTKVEKTRTGIIVHPPTNVAGLQESFDISERVAAECPQLSGFGILALNDAEAATHGAPDLLEGDLEDKIVTFITHSTGIGGDSIINGTICSRADGMWAEYGHIAFKLPDGSYTTWENSASGTAIEVMAGKSAKSSANDFFQEADDIWDGVGRSMGQGIGILIPIIGMAHVVIGGGVSRSHQRYDKTLRNELAQIIMAMPDTITEEAPQLTYVPKDKIDTIGMQGAYFAAQQRYLELA